MQMRDGLAAVRIRIGHEAPARVLNFLGAGNPDRFGDKFAQKRSVLGMRIGKIRDVAFRDQNNMLWGLGMNIAETEPRRGFAHDRGGQLPVYDPAEQTFFSHTAVKV